ncbi:MAG: hypothetical protein K8T26_13435 [Lentisphaerae bacterium]|nr:hypothetical protein [Lentisphaerota bacterium]
MELMIGEVFLKAAILCGLLYFIARHEADYSFQKVAMVTAGLMLGSVLIDAAVKPHLGPWTAIIHVAFIAFMIMTFCWITFWKSLVVVVVYVGVHFALALLGGMALGYLHKESSKSAGMVMMGANESEFKEMQSMINDNAERAMRQAGAGMEEAAGEAAPEPAAPAVEEDRAPALAARVADATPPPAPPEPAAEAATPAAGEDEWVTAEKSLVVGGMASGSRGAPTVFINGQLREAGDVISATSHDQLYRWRILSIGDKGVRLKPIDKRPAPIAVQTP